MHVCLSLWACMWVCVCVCGYVCSVLMVVTEELVPEAKGPHAVGSFLLFPQGLHEIWHLQIWTKQHYLSHGGNGPKVLREMLAFGQAHYCWTQRRTTFSRMHWRHWKSQCENPSWGPFQHRTHWILSGCGCCVSGGGGTKLFWKQSPPPKSDPNPHKPSSKTVYFLIFKISTSSPSTGYWRAGVTTVLEKVRSPQRKPWWPRNAWNYLLSPLLSYVFNSLPFSYFCFKQLFMVLQMARWNNLNKRQCIRYPKASNNNFW